MWILYWLHVSLLGQNTWQEKDTQEKVVWTYCLRAQFFMEGKLCQQKLGETTYFESCWQTEMQRMVEQEMEMESKERETDFLLLGRPPGGKSYHINQPNLGNASHRYACHLGTQDAVKLTILAIIEVYHYVVISFFFFPEKMCLRVTVLITYLR